MKKLLFVLFAFVLFLSACGGGNDTAGNGGNEEGGNGEEVEEITVWAWDPNFNIAALDIAEEMWDGDVEINVVDVTQLDIVQRLNTMFSAGTTEGLPNIVLIGEQRSQSFLRAFPDQFYELTDYINPDDFAPFKVEMTSVDGRQYAVPFDSGVTGLFVRVDILEQAGYTIEDVTNVDWDQLIDIAVDVKEQTGIHFLTLHPDSLGARGIDLQSAGSWFTKEDGVTPNLENNEALKASIRVLKRMIDEGIMLPISDWAEGSAAVNDGDVFAMHGANWGMPTMRQEESQSGLWRVVPTPRLPGVEGAANASNNGGSSWYVLDIPGREQAAQFLADTFGSNVEFYDRLLTEVGAIGTFLPAADSEAYGIEDEFFGGQQVFRDFAEWNALVPPVNYGLHTIPIMDILTPEIQNIINNGKDIDQALRDAQALAESQLN